ncbi:DUF167 family protein [Microbaculum sp. FT89]|uniref:DUF167 family protein n=1 Tax=Microbaculum sp. FT89 TaxID=3447298 RepID=UPI003F532967
MSADHAPDWFKAVSGGIDIHVRLTPKSSRDQIDGVAALSDDSRVLAARVRAVPEKGAANTALEKLLAKALGVARATVAVASGHKARLKTVHVAGDAGELECALRALESNTEGDRP